MIQINQSISTLLHRLQNVTAHHTLLFKDRIQINKDIHVHVAGHQIPIFHLHKHIMQKKLLQ